MYRDHDFLDADTLGAMAAQDQPGAFIFNCWVESWGEHKWFACEPDDPQAKALGIMDGKPAEGMFRLNSIYPPDGFWWDSQLRITPAFPAGDHFLEHYAHAVAEFDALRITRGGLFLDKAHTEELRRFAVAYRSLPRQKFRTIGSTTDPVAVRTRVQDDRHYGYAINRDYYPVQVEIVFSASPGRLRDLATQQEFRASRHWRFTLAPYEMRAFAFDPKIELTRFSAEPPREIADALLADGRQALLDIDRLAAGKRFVMGMTRMRTEITAAIDQRRFAWLRRALSSYIVRQCRNLLAQG